MADKGTIDDLHLDEKNFNRHTKAGMELLQKSILENKFGRSILVDKDGNIIAGNATVETARKLGKTKTKVVETIGDECVGVVPFEHIVAVAKNYIQSIGGFERFAEWGLIR